MKLLGTRRLAKELGVVPSAITRAYKEGRITPAGFNESGDPQYELAATREEWLANTAPRASTGLPGITVPGLEQQTGEKHIDRYNKARADKEEAIAAQEKLKLAELQKVLLPKDKMIATFTQFLRATSQALSGVAGKTLSRFPGLTDEGRDYITDEISVILDDLSRWEPGK